MSTQSGGLVGASKSLLSMIPAKHSLAMGLVILAGVLTIAKKNGAEIPNYALYFGISLGVAALITEMMTIKDTVKAWWAGRVGAAIASLAVWFVAFSYGVFNWMGAAAEKEAAKTNVHKAAYMQTVSAQDNLKASKADLDRLQNRLAWMDTAVNGKPVRTPEAAQADIDNAMSNRFWDKTAGCTETKGPQTRAFCDAYRLAIAEKALAVEKATLAEEVKVARLAYDKARDAASATPVETSEARSDMVILTGWMGVTEQDAEVSSALFQIIAISIFLSFLSARQAILECIAEGSRTPLNWGLKLRRWISHTLHGREPSDVTVIRENYRVEDKFARDLATMLKTTGAELKGAA